jgi:hypothetical protein
MSALPFSHVSTGPRGICIQLSQPYRDRPGWPLRP